MRNKKDIERDIEVCLASMHRIVQREKELALKGNNLSENDYDHFLFLQEEFNSCINDYYHYREELDGKPQN